MIRRALVDWGDEIIDAILEKIEDPKIIERIEAVRAELVDPLRVSVNNG
jgi:hypothetical protein